MIILSFARSWFRLGRFVSLFRVKFLIVHDMLGSSLQWIEKNRKIPCVSKKVQRDLEADGSLVYHACAFITPLLLCLMETEAEEREGDHESKKLRGRSKTTPPASNQFAMSNSLDSGVGSFEEADVGDNSCTTIDEHTLVTGQHDRETPHSFRFIYLGNAVLDKRYTQPMLPWFIAEIRRKRERNPIDLRVE